MAQADRVYLNVIYDPGAADPQSKSFFCKSGALLLVSTVNVVTFANHLCGNHLCSSLHVRLPVSAHPGGHGAHGCGRIPLWTKWAGKSGLHVLVERKGRR